MPKSHFKIERAFDCPSDPLLKRKKNHSFKTTEVFSLKYIFIPI